MRVKGSPPETARSPLVGGPKKEIILLLIGLHVFWIALAVYRNPFSAFTVWRALRRKYRLFHGDFPILKLARAGGLYFRSLYEPGWPSASFRSFMRNELNRIRPFQPDRGHLSTMIFAVSSRCPLRCEHCFEWQNLDRREALSLGDLKEILEKFQRRGIDQVQLSGGEPLCRLDDTVELIRTARAGTDYWLLTSGYGLTREVAARLKEAGLTGVSVSLDHWDEERHNAFRRDDRSFYWVREAARNSREVDLPVCLSLCAVKDFVTAEDLWRYVYLAKEWGAGFVRLLEPRKAGRFEDKDVELEDEHVEMLQNFYETVNSNSAYRELPIVNYPGYHQRLIGCVGAGNRYLYVDSRGGLHACPFCQNEVGNVLVDPLDDAIREMKRTGCHAFETNARV